MPISIEVCIFCDIRAFDLEEGSDLQKLNFIHDRVSITSISIVCIVAKEVDGKEIFWSFWSYYIDYIIIDCGKRIEITGDLKW